MNQLFGRVKDSTNDNYGHSLSLFDFTGDVTTKQDFAPE